VLTKEFKFVPPEQEAAQPDLQQPDENGITNAMLEFSWETHIEPSVSRSFTYTDPC
jgi:hypothetical protein